MYVRKELNTKSLDNKKKIKIGPDVVLFKYVEDFIDDHSLSIVEGEIYHVGQDFAEILQKNQKVVTVKIDRITHVKWKDCGKSLTKFDRIRCHHCGKGHTEIREQCPHCHENHEPHKHRPWDGDNHHSGHTHSPHCHDGHFNRGKYSKDSYIRRNDGCCRQKFSCFCDHAIPFCDNRFELRLAGLDDDIKFKLLQHKGCYVEIKLG